MNKDPIPVEDLREQRKEEFDFPVTPGTNEETALRFLASEPKVGWPPSKVAKHTDIDSNNVTKTLQSLYEKGLVDRIKGRYFVNPDLQEEINGLLGDLHNIAQSQAHPKTG